jgi:hypothetical protein
MSSSLVFYTVDFQESGIGEKMTKKLPHICQTCQLATTFEFCDT